MKKWLLITLLIFTFIFVGCSTNKSELDFKDTDNFKTLSNVVYPKQDYISYKDLDSTIKYSDFNYLNNFMNQTTKEIFSKEENSIYSPISLYMSLSMLAQGAEGETKDEIMNLLMADTELSLETINKYNQTIYNHNYYKNDKGNNKIANSIWIRNNFPVKEQFITDLSTYYYANSYSTNFDDEGKQNLADWINHNTNDLLKITKDTYPITSETEIMLVNTLYFNNKWDLEFKKQNNFKDIFYGVEQTEVEYMKHTVESIYYETETCEIFYDYFKNDNKIKYIFPKETSSIEECLNNDILNMSLSNLTSTQVMLTLSVPKFKNNSTHKLNETLQKLGLNQMFEEFADFSKITDYDIYVSFVQQDAGIIFNEEGAEAAAVTSTGMDSESVGPVYLPKNIILNRPFIYVITDAYDVPLFVGTVYNPEYK